MTFGSCTVLGHHVRLPSAKDFDSWITKIGEEGIMLDKVE